MLYKGEDLELMTPDEWAGVRVDRDAPWVNRRGHANGIDLTPDWLDRALVPQHETQSLWVDETVLECCNKAYDLAVVHHAGEVGLEHLVHAMTLDADAIDVLRSYEIDVTSLRTESAARLANARPASLAKRGAAPSNSEEFKGILKLAADHAYDQGQPVSIAQILEAMLAMNSPVNPPIANLLKNNPSLRYGAGANAAPNQQTAAGTATASINGIANGVAANPIMTQLGETFYALLNDPSTRGEALTLLGSAFGTNLLGQIAPPAGQTAQPTTPNPSSPVPNAQAPAVQPPQPQTPQSPAMQTPQSPATQNALDPVLLQLLNSIRDKVVELKADDDQQQDDLEKKWNNTVDGLSRSFDSLSASVTSKLGAFDATTLAAFQKVADDLTKLDLDQKFKDLETSLTAKVGALTSTDVADLKIKLTALQTALAAAPVSSVSMAGVETKLDTVLSKVTELDTLDDKFDAHVMTVKGLLAGLQSSDLADLKKTIGDLKTTITSSPSSSIEVAQLKAKLTEVDATVDNIEKLVKRIDDPDGQIADQIKSAQRKLVDEISNLKPTNLASLETDIEELKVLLKDADGGPLGDAKLVTLLEKVDDKVEAVSYQVSKLDGVGGGALSTADLSNLAKLVATEMSGDWSLFKTSMDGELVKLQASLKGVDAENDARYDALVKLNQNQQALANAVDRLREELQDYNLKLTTGVQTTDPKIAEELRALKEMVEKRQDFWTRFRIWLFGTNDWYSASWGRRVD